MKKLLLFFLILILIIGCVLGYFVATARLPTVKINQVSVEFVAPGQANLLTQVEIENHLKIPLELFMADYEIAIEKNVISNGKVEIQGKLGSNQTSVVTLPISVNFAKWKEARKEIQGSQIPLTISGNIHCSLKVKKIVIPFSFKKNLDREGNKIQCKVSKFDIVLEPDRQFKLDIEISLVNPLPTSVYVGSVQYEAVMKEKAVLTGTVSSPKEMKPKEEGTFHIPVHIDFASIKSILKASDEAVLLTLKGNVLAKILQEEVAIPFEIKKELPSREKRVVWEVKDIVVEQKGEAIQIVVLIKIQGEFAKKVEFGKVPYQIKIGNDELTSGEADIRNTVQKEAFITLEVPILLEIAKLLEMKETHIADTVIVLNVSGKLPIKAAEREIVLPFDFTKEIKRDGPKMELRVENVTISQKDEGLQILASIQLKSKVARLVTSVHAEYELKAGNEQVASGKVEIQSQKTEDCITGQIPVEVEINKLKELKQKYMGVPIPLELRGTAILGLKNRNLQLPFHVSKEVTLKGIPFGLTVKGVKVVSIDPEALGLLVQLEIASKIKKDLPGVQLSYKISAENQTILQGDLKLNPVPASGTSQAEVPVTIDAKKFRQIKKEHIGKKTPVSIEGNVSTSFQNQKFEIPFSITKDIEFKERPIEVKIKKVRIKKFRLQGCIYHVVVEVTNCTSLEIKDIIMDGKIEISKDVEVDVLNKNITLLPNQPTQLSIEMETEKGGLAKLLFQLVKNKITKSSWKLKFRGKTSDGATITSEHSDKGSVPVEEQ